MLQSMQHNCRISNLIYCNVCCKYLFAVLNLITLHPRGWIFHIVSWTAPILRGRRSYYNFLKPDIGLIFFLSIWFILLEQWHHGEVHSVQHRQAQATQANSEDCNHFIEFSPSVVWSEMFCAGVWSRDRNSFIITQYTCHYLWEDDE